MMISKKMMRKRMKKSMMRKMKNKKNNKIKLTNLAIKLIDFILIYQKTSCFRQIYSIFKEEVKEKKFRYKDLILSSVLNF